MLRVYTSDEIPDQDKRNTGSLLLGLQQATTYKPLTFSVAGDNSAITSFEAVEYDQYGTEIARTSLSTSLIVVDSGNNIYKVDGSTIYADKLTDDIYRFEFENASEIPYKTEYFLVKEQTIYTKFDTNGITWDTNLITFDQINTII